MPGTTMQLIGVGIAGLLLLVLVLLTFRWRRARGTTRRAFPGGRPVELGTEHEPYRAPGEPPKNAEVAAIEHSKLVIHAILKSVTENVGSLLDDSTEYGDSLERHKADVKKAMTVAGIRELERVMLTELGEMLSSNAHYREQLDKANAKLESQQKELERLQTDTGIDFLTKVPNRRSFDQRFKEELNRASRYGSVFSIVVIDLDHFKNVNDSYGHLAGDRVLRAVAQLLDEEKRTSDFFARYGGEEFVFLLPETQAEQARILAEKMRKRVEEARFRYEKESLRITISAGVGMLNSSEETGDALFARVDSALYFAKEMGRNRVEMAGPRLGTID